MCSVLPESRSYQNKKELKKCHNFSDFQKGQESEREWIFSKYKGDLHSRCINSNRRCKYLWRWLWQTDKTAHFDISPSVLAKCISGRMKNEGNRGQRVLHRMKKHTSRLWVQSSRHWKWGSIGLDQSEGRKLKGGLLHLNRPSMSRAKTWEGDNNVMIHHTITPVSMKGASLLRPRWILK